jgi:hypothetical protein
LERGANSPNPARLQPRLTRPLRLVELIPSTTAPSASRYMVRVGAHAIEVDDQFAEATLRRLVAVLASC